MDKDAAATEQLKRHIGLINAAGEDPFKTTVVTLLLDLRTAQAETSDRLSSLERDLRDMVPNGDIDGHRKAHEADMDRRKANAEIGQGVKKRVAEGVVWAVVLGLAFAVWDWLKKKLVGGVP